MNRTALDKWICECEGLDELTRGSLDALMLRKLNALLRRERARDGFYSRLPESLGSLSELSSLPFTTGRELAEKAPGLLLTSQSEIGRVITDRTSGTTGGGKRVFYTAGDCADTVGFFAAGLSELVRPGDGVLIAMPFSGSDGLGELISRAVESLGARPVRAGVGLSFARLHELAERESAADFVGMPVPLLSLLRLYGRGGLERALVSGDVCPQSVMTGIESILGSRLFPHYGSREMCLGGAVTCPAHEGMHLRENHVIAEIIAPDGTPLPDGEEGELVVTTVGMEAMPLIRYRTGDLCRILPDSCPCGGVTRRISEVRRTDSAMERLDNALFSLRGVIDYAAKTENGALALDVSGSADENAVMSAARGVFPSLDVRVSIRPASAGDAPAYIGKRVIL